MFKKSWLKGCALFAVLFLGAAQLPATAASYADLKGNDQVLLNNFVITMHAGIVKGYELSTGKKIEATPKDIQIRYALRDAFPDILAEIKRAGFYDEYLALAADREVQQMNGELTKVKTVEELRQLAERQKSYVAKKYPRLAEWMNSSKELEAVVAPMMRKVMEILEK